MVDKNKSFESASEQLPQLQAEITLLKARCSALQAENELYCSIFGKLHTTWYGKIVLKFRGFLQKKKQMIQSSLFSLTHRF